MLFFGVTAALVLGTASASERRLLSTSKRTCQAESSVRAAVIGGIVMSGVYAQLESAFNALPGRTLPVCLSVKGNKEVILPAFRRGEADVILMHSSDDLALLTAEGYVSHLTPWAFNDLILVGPPEDPAGIQNLTNGTEAIRRIAADSNATFIFPSMGTGQSTVLSHLLTASGARPDPSWLIPSDAPDPQNITEAAAARGAYTIVGRLPFAKGKIPKAGLIQMVAEDPKMRRPYLAAVADPERLQGCSPMSASLEFVRFVRSEEAQRLISSFGRGQRERGEGGPFVFPLPYLWEEEDEKEEGGDSHSGRVSWS
uniref:PBP domain-containing protein n=1 Tax=Chromera velia CCMP2878 TaxID=1169474 RepID=A0A0G4F2C5_9ALVE|eukprot:Cvel_14885.t1-p1 / transcript=Cvel_14885.t1 / gene=Cvel_14885 / organism=Chromera_velia_CCMP2878 / gene_product=Putative ABC transporter anion-binding protein, putative / transcript_product=Putative ABC transporter anion-binding protein, putative / location=Cvel_scaffold1077:5284-7063(-) / protein_length=312 / sequence_SO=supercontig / SO=protein_coding / is_pseudo=false